jgi:flagellar hook-associated protein 2
MNVNPTSSNVNDYLSMPLSMPGLASGMDWQSLIQKMMSVSEEPLNRLESQKTELENEQGALENTFKPMLEDFRQSLLTLELSSTFTAKSSSVSDTSVLNADVSSTALEGTYQVKVDKMATFTTLTPSTTVGKAIDPTQTLDGLNLRNAITSGYITINGVQIDIDPSTQSLNDVIDAINNSGAGVTAAYDSTTDKMTLTAAGNTIINVGSPSDTSNFLQAMYLSGAPEEVNTDGNTVVTSTVHIGAIDPASTLSSLGIESGNVKINGVDISVDPTQTLQSFLEEINNSSANVTAWYDYNSDKVYLRSKIGGAVSISTAESDTSNPTNVINTFGWDSGATQSAGQNAQIEISMDGGATWTTYSRSTNTITDVLPGVTFNLYSSSTTPVTLTVSQDTSKAVDAIQGFVDSFNKIVNWINTQYNQQPPKDTQNVSGSATQGALYHNEMIDSVLSKMKSMVYQLVPGLSKYSSLPSVGISTGSVGSGWYQTMIGTISLDKDKLQTALQDDPQQVYELFANDPTSSTGDPNAGEGVIQQLDDTLYSFTEFNGIIDQYASNQGYIGQRLLSLNSQITQTASFLKQQQLYYIQQYTAMERMLSGLSGESSYISSAMAKSSSH